MPVGDVECRDLRRGASVILAHHGAPARVTEPDRMSDLMPDGVVQRAKAPGHLRVDLHVRLARHRIVDGQPEKVRELVRSNADQSWLDPGQASGDPDVQIKLGDVIHPIARGSNDRKTLIEPERGIDEQRVLGRTGPRELGSRLTGASYDKSDQRG